jgi:hypothetical protein
VTDAGSAATGAFLERRLSLPIGVAIVFVAEAYFLTRHASDGLLIALVLLYTVYSVATTPYTVRIDGAQIELGFLARPRVVVAKRDAFVLAPPRGALRCYDRGAARRRRFTLSAGRRSRQRIEAALGRFRYESAPTAPPP